MQHLTTTPDSQPVLPETGLDEVLDVDSVAEEVRADFELIGESLRIGARSFLRDKHCVLWGEKFNIVDPKGRERAISWLIDAMQNVSVQASLVALLDRHTAQTGDR